MVIIRFESDHKSVITATLPNNRRLDLLLHIIFNSNETMTEMNTHRNENPAQFHMEKQSVQENEALRSNTMS